MKLIPRIKQTIYFLIFTFVFSIYPENTWCTPQETTLTKKINTILYKHKPKDAFVGISIFSISKKKSLYRLNSDKPFIVASNMKLFTTATALIYLRPDFEYKTKIFYRGNISSDGKLNGDIIIKGSGDPNISGRFHEDNATAVPNLWANAVKQQGIKIITGDIIADDTIFDREFICDSWPKNQLSKWYCAPVSGLSFNDNCINIIVQTNKKPGASVNIQTEPKTSYVEIINNCKTTTLKSKHSYSLHRKPSTSIIYIKGYVWIKAQLQKQWITIHNPPLYTAAVFKEILENKNIQINGKARVINSTDLNSKHKTHKLTETTSNLRQSIMVTNKRSQGFYAEQILKTLGAHIKKEGSFSAGLNVIKDFLAKLGFSEEQYQFEDGSGLSKKNKLSPQMITKLLYIMNKHKYAPVFLKSLPISGIDGTLKNRLKEEPYRFRIRAKTGYVHGVSALSGYIKTLDKEIIAFSIIINNIKGGTRHAKRLQDAICRLLVTYSHSMNSSVTQK
ncbi:MAG: D-alanyl-D-alanine carboxypeptidase/D-alanyl-D-alanine-endopeptidase [Candidatus Scalinduaceae bacterium]